MGVDLVGFLEKNVDIHHDPPSDRAYFLAARFWFHRCPILRSRLTGGFEDFPRIHAPRGTIEQCSRDVRSAVVEESLEFVGWLTPVELEEISKVFSSDRAPVTPGQMPRTAQFENEAPRAEFLGLLALMERLSGAFPAVRLVLALSV
jgi:hypothetical protein